MTVTFIYANKTKLERNQYEPIVKYITRIELFGLNERLIEEARSKVKTTEEVKQKDCMHWNSGFCKQSQCYYVYTDEDCNNHLEGQKCRYRKCRDTQGQTGTDKDRQGHTWTDKDTQGQTGTDRDRQGQKGT